MNAVLTVFLAGQYLNNDEDGLILYIFKDCLHIRDDTVDLAGK